jgi:hypothetical protein
MVSKSHRLKLNPGLALLLNLEFYFYDFIIYFFLVLLGGEVSGWETLLKILVFWYYGMIDPSYHGYCSQS